jgi:hypothetical protein
MLYVLSAGYYNENISTTKRTLKTTSRKEHFFTDILLGNDHETNETTAIARQQLHKYETVFMLLLGRGPRATMEVLLKTEFFMLPTPKLYHSTDRVQFSADRL